MGAEVCARGGSFHDGTPAKAPIACYARHTCAPRALNWLIDLATTEVGAKESWRIWGVGATVTSFLKSWEGVGAQAQWAELSHKCAAAQQSLFLHLVARMSLLEALDETTLGELKAKRAKTLSSSKLVGYHDGCRPGASAELLAAANSVVELTRLGC